MSANSGLENKKKVESVLQSLDGIQRADAPAFFYTRLRARMEEELGGWPILRLFSKPVLVIAIASVVLLLNATAITEMLKVSNAPATTASTSVAESAQAFAAEYQLSTYTVYDENQ